MKKKIIGIFVCMLLIVTTIPVIGSMNNKKTTITIERTVIQPSAMENWTEIQKLIPTDGEEEDSFGHKVSISGDYAIIGSPYDDDNGVNSGSAYIYARSGSIWNQQAKLLASDGASGDWFGYSVFLDGDTAIIGAYMDDNPIELAGSAYIFVRNGVTWSQQAKLIASDSEYIDAFGASVSISRDTVLIGAPGVDDNGHNSGAAYVFIRSGTSWTQQAKLLTLDGETEDNFGWPVSIDGDTALIGVCEDDDYGENSGSAYVFIRTGTTWTQQAKLLASDSAAGDVFGFSVSLDEDIALIGAYSDNTTVENSGSSYVFVRNNTIWSQQAKLLASDPTMYAGFGWSVSIYDDYAVISALGDNLARGAAYIFKRSNNNWIQEEKLTASDGDIQDWFGCSVSIFEDIIFIGANLDDDNAEDSGSAYVFVKEADNQPPVAPTINGPIKGLPLIPYQFTFTSTDPDGDDVSYYVDWGDGFITSWTSYQSSGSPGYSKSHSWTAFDVFTIKAKVKDINGLESAWTNYSFSTPRNRVINTVFVNFLGNHQNLFPILRHLLGL